MKEINNFLNNLRKPIAAVMTVALFALLGVASVSATDKNFVKVYVDGESYSVSTDNLDVQSVIDALNITVGENDLVEPALDAEVSESPFYINVYRAQSVLVIDGEDRITVSTPHSSGKDIAKDAGLKINSKDEFTVERVDNFLEENIVGLKVTIDRAEKYEVNVFGNAQTVYSQSSSVQQILDESGIDYSEADLIEPQLSASLKDGDIVNLYKEGISEVIEEEVIQFTTQTVNDDTIDRGVSQVETAGKNGLKEVTYEVFTRNGEEISRTQISSTTITEPVQEVVKVGTKGEVLAAQGTGDCSMVYNYDWPTDVAYGICMAESTGNPNAANFNDHHGSCIGSYSLMQVACFWYPFYGYSTADFYNSSINMQIAYNIWQRQGGFTAWTTYTSGLYLNY